MIKKTFALSIVLAGLMAFFTQGQTAKKDSLFELKTQWTTSQGKQVALSEFKGKWTLITMAYTSCSYACPRIVENLKSIEKDLQKNKIDSYHIVLASFDPKTDTPSKLTDFMKKKNLNQARWTMMTAKNDADVRELAAILGITFKRQDEVDFAHSNVISLLDPEGRIQTQINGLNADRSGVIKIIKK